MSYQAGIGPSLATQLGIVPRGPHIFCDGCGVIRSIETKTSYAAQWFLKGRHAPGWSLVRTENEDGSVTRVDLCPKCKAAKSGGMEA
jgi:hypothetical protein